MWNASFTFDSREEKSIIPEPPNLSSCLSRNIEGEISHFPLYPLYDLSGHEDAPICDLELFDYGYHDLFIESFDHDFDSSTIDISKSSALNDPYFDELKPPQVVEALQTRMMVMSSFCSLELGSTSN